jgi:hypothetical protein
MTRGERRLRPHPKLAWRLVEDHLFLLNERDEFLVVEDPVGLFLWRLLDEQPRTRAELLEALLAEFDVGEAQAAADLDDFLATLVKHLALQSGTAAR